MDGSHVPYVQTVIGWFHQHSSTAAFVIFGGGVLAVAFYTYVQDYLMLAKRDKG